MNEFDVRNKPNYTTKVSSILGLDDFICPKVRKLSLLQQHSQSQRSEKKPGELTWPHDFSLSESAVSVG